MEPLSAVCQALIELGPQVKIVNLLCALERPSYAEFRTLLRNHSACQHGYLVL